MSARCPLLQDPPSAALYGGFKASFQHPPEVQPDFGLGLRVQGPEAECRRCCKVESSPSTRTPLLPAMAPEGRAEMYWIVADRVANRRASRPLPGQVQQKSARVSNKAATNSSARPGPPRPGLRKGEDDVHVCPGQALEQK